MHLWRKATCADLETHTIKSLSLSFLIFLSQLIRWRHEVSIVFISLIDDHFRLISWEKKPSNLNYVLSAYLISEPDWKHTTGTLLYHLILQNSRLPKSRGKKRQFFPYQSFCVLKNYLAWEITLSWLPPVWRNGYNLFVVNYLVATTVFC